jgi:hypothetical protein
MKLQNINSKTKLLSKTLKDKLDFKCFYIITYIKV